MIVNGVGGSEEVEHSRGEGHFKRKTVGKQQEDERLRKKWKCVSIKQFYNVYRNRKDMKRHIMSLYKLSHVGRTERRK